MWGVPGPGCWELWGWWQEVAREGHLWGTPGPVFVLVTRIFCHRNLVLLLLLVFCICFLLACVLYLQVTRVQVRACMSVSEKLQCLQVQRAWSEGAVRVVLRTHVCEWFP